MTAPRALLWLLLWAACSQQGGGSSADGGSSSSPRGDGGRDPGPPRWNAAVGARGTFLQSFDGQGWRLRVVGEADLLAVHCISPTLGWVAGAGGLLLRTSDGGQRFTQVPTGVTAALRALRFDEDPTAAQEALVGVAAGDDGTLLLSGDGGTSWRRVDTGTRAALRGVAVARRLLLVVGDGGVVLRSADQGQSWQRSALQGDLQAVALDPRGALALVASADRVVWESRDGGLRFTVATLAQGPLRALSMNHEGWVLAAGDRGTALRRDPAFTWSALATGTQADLHAALLQHQGPTAFLAGAGGLLLRSGDRGATWGNVFLATSSALFGLEEF